MRQSRERGTCCKLENLVIVRSAITENLFWALCGDVAGTDSLSPCNGGCWTYQSFPTLRILTLQRKRPSHPRLTSFWPPQPHSLRPGPLILWPYEFACLPFALLPEVLLPLWRSSQEHSPTLRKQMSALTWLSLTAPKPSLLLEEGAAVFVFSKLSSPEETKFSSCLSDPCGGEWNSV